MGMCRCTDVSIDLVNGPLTFSSGNVQVERCIEFVNGLLTFSRGNVQVYRCEYRLCERSLDVQQWECAGEQMYRVCERPLDVQQWECAGEQMYRVCERPLDVQQREMCRWTDVSSL